MIKNDLDELSDRIDASLQMARGAGLDVLSLLLSMASLEVSRLVELIDGDDAEPQG